MTKHQLTTTAKFLFIDLFCGAGGVSEGARKAVDKDGRRLVKLMACVNHNPVCIASHAKNHPKAAHYIEDVRSLDLHPLRDMIRQDRMRNPEVKVILWASLECTHFSRARGGGARKQGSRTLANSLVRYIKVIQPDYVMIENVEAFMSWGPLDDSGRPISKKNGRDYIKWISRVQHLGYKYDYRLLDAANYGAPTNRIRYFGIFALPGNPIRFPDATHAQNPSEGLFGKLQPWIPVRDVLDLDDHGRSVFERDKPLSDRTFQRILAGLKKFIPKSEYAWLLKYHLTGQRKPNKGASVETPAPTVCTGFTPQLVQCQFFNNYYSGGGDVRSIDRPGPTLVTTRTPTMLSPQFIQDTQYSNKGRSIDRPCQTLIARMDKKPPYLVSPEFEGSPYWEIQDEDSPACVEVKKFMMEWGIADIKMRMLKIPELLQIQGFPANYHLEGTKGDQKMQIGNAVPPQVVRRLIEANAE